MGEKQPSAAAKRLVDVLWDADVLRSTRTTIEASTVIESAARTLDAAGVGKAVEHLSALARLAYAEGEPDSNVWVRKTRLALAALTGNDNAK